MSLRTIRWTKRAVKRLDQIGAYIAKENPDAAANVIARPRAQPQTLLWGGYG